MYQDICTSKSDDSLLHLEVGHDFVAPYDSKQRRRNEWCLYWVYKMILFIITLYYKMDNLKLITKSGFWFFNLLRAPRSLFLVYKLGLKKWLKRAFENYLMKQKTILF
jgi:hypothetical protein